MLARTWKYLIAVGGLVITAACADDQPAARVTMPGRASAAFAAPGTDFTLMKKDARAYFVSSQDPVFDLIQQLASLNKTGPDAAFRQKAFEILAYVGSVAGQNTGPTAVVTTAAAGDAFVRDVLTALGFSTNPGTFTGALGNNGLFGVRGGPNDPPGALISRGTPTYGAEPKDATWAASIAPQFLMYGYPRAYTGFSNEPPAALTAYELATVPVVPVFAAQIRAGVCQTLGTAPTPRLQHKTVILAKDVPIFCTGITSRVNDQGHGVLAFARRLSDWIAPRPLFAAMAVVGGMGGSLGGLSPIGAVNVDVTTVTLSYTQQPSNGSINQVITPFIKVKALTAAGTPLGGLVVRLTVVGNSGSFTTTGTEATTDATGVATFSNFKTDKAGGYTLTATGSFDWTVPTPTTTQPVTSVLFNVNGQQ